MSRLADASLLALAQAAGLQAVWRDVRGAERQVGADTLRAVLQSLGLACGNAEQCRASLEQLRESRDQTSTAGLQIVPVGRTLVVRSQGSLHYRLQLENGVCVMGTARDVGGGRVAIPPFRQAGYHRLEMGGLQCTVAVIPPRAPSLQSLLRRGAGSCGDAVPRGHAHSARETASDLHAWVLSAQLQSLRRGGTHPDGHVGAGAVTLPGWEVGGDFSLLGRLAQEAAQQGAAALAVSPVHAMFSADAQRYSPYAPSSRLFLNVMYADPAAVFDADILNQLSAEPSEAALDAAGCMDWPVIQTQRLRRLRHLFDLFETFQPVAPLDDFFAFRRQGGEALSGHACYEALHADFLPTLGPAHGWRDWPGEYHDPAGPAVQRFADTHERELRFHAFLQWLAARSLAAAQARALACMPIGLIADMAVGTDPRGSHAWSRQEQIMSGVSVGAPPDLFQPEGQDWGLTAFSPWGLRRHGYAGFIETVRAALAHAGGVRIDHVMGLARMWLVPEGAPPSGGIYIGYPFKELMDLLTLEAWRHEALVVGENLGTVPEGFTEEMDRRGFLGMSVLWFERVPGDATRFRLPQQWPAHTMAMATTHDLPTLRGWWVGRDIAWRERQGEYSEQEALRQRRVREEEKQALWSAMCEAGLADPDTRLPEAAPVAEMLSYVAGTPAVLFSVALEDITGQEEQVNLPGRVPPGQTDSHPNWRRTLSVPVDDLLRRGEAPLLLAAIRRARGMDDGAGSGT